MNVEAKKRRIIIMGAAGRDFHNFNMVYRDNPNYEVVAFTAAQIPGIEGRIYPPELAGCLYPRGVPIIAEQELAQTVCAENIDDVVFAYSDLTHAEVMHRASIALSAGANFILLGPNATMLSSIKPIISVCAVRTGVGKSQLTRWLSAYLKGKNLRVSVIRHPMPYGDLHKQIVQRFSTREDLITQRCTLEEREEYEPHIASGSVVFAGVDYSLILKAAEKDADVILWDGGNNDFPFIKPDLSIALVDALRPEQCDTHHPGETVLRMADIVIIAKANDSPHEKIAQLRQAVARIAPRAIVTSGSSRVKLDDPSLISGKRVIIVEDGPTLTHGGMAYGAGYIAARMAGAIVVDPRPFAVGTLAAAFTAYPHLGEVLPALGYSEAQLRDLEQTLNSADAEMIVVGTPVDLGALVKAKVPVLRARYDFEEMDAGLLAAAVDNFLICRDLI
jgi:predicted GTPase